MRNLYEFDQAEEDGTDRGSQQARGIQHAFVFDRESRRMLCQGCGGVMNECEEYCRTKKAL